MTTIRRSLLLVFFTALPVLAQPAKVLITAHGKTYHSHVCMALARSKAPIGVTLEQAKNHGLAPCGICYRTPAKKRAGNADWAKEGK